MFNFLKPANVVKLLPEEVHERVRNAEICLVDVREANEWAQMHLPGAIHAPLSNLASTLDGLPNEKTIVFYCLSGMRSARAIELCRSLGKPHNAHIGGGITAWRLAGLPIDA
jgi:rhodanese-related sulfurtransferase